MTTSWNMDRIAAGYVAFRPSLGLLHHEDCEDEQRRELPAFGHSKMFAIVRRIGSVGGRFAGRRAATG